MQLQYSRARFYNYLNSAHLVWQEDDDSFLCRLKKVCYDDFSTRALESILIQTTAVDTFHSIVSIPSAPANCPACICRGCKRLSHEFVAPSFYILRSAIENVFPSNPPGSYCLYSEIYLRNVIVFHIEEFQNLGILLPLLPTTTAIPPLQKRLELATQREPDEVVDTSDFVTLNVDQDVDLDVFLNLLPKPEKAQSGPAKRKRNRATPRASKKAKSSNFTAATVQPDSQPNYYQMIEQLCNDLSAVASTIDLQPLGDINDEFLTFYNSMDSNFDENTLLL